MNEKDTEQDEMIRHNAERIKRNEEAILRQTEALEKIRDHYYPPPAKPWRRLVDFGLKALCVVLAYAGGVQALDWYFNVRKADAMAAQCAKVAHMLFMQQGDIVGALRFYDKAVELNEGDVRYRMERAFVKNMNVLGGLFDLGRPLTEDEINSVDEALAEATFLQSSEPDEALPYILAAQAKLLRGEREAAKASVLMAVERAPDVVQVHISACAIHFMSGDIAGARKQIAVAEKLDATHPLVSCWKGMIALVADRDVVSARRSFEEMVRQSPGLALGHALLARALLAGPQTDLKATRTALERALVADAMCSPALLGMAEVFEREGNFIVARLWLNRALTCDARNMKALVARARLALRTGDCAAAQTDISAAIELAPFRADLYRLQAEAYEKAGDKTQAKAARATAEALEPRVGFEPTRPCGS